MYGKIPKIDFVIYFGGAFKLFFQVWKKFFPFGKPFRDRTICISDF